MTEASRYLTKAELGNAAAGIPTFCRLLRRPMQPASPPSPITSLEARLKCPMFGPRKASIIFDVPNVPAAMRIAGMPSG